MDSWAYGIVESIALLPDGRVLVAGDTLAILDPNMLTSKDIETTESLQSIDSLIIAQDNSVWIGGQDDGATHLTLDDSLTHAVDSRRYNSRDGLVSDEVVDIAITPDGAVWFASPGGIARCYIK